MKPEEFWGLTPAEIGEMADGYEEKMNMQMQMLAWHAANLMNIHLERRNMVTVDKLLGKEKKIMSKEDREAQFAELIHLMDRKGA